MVYTPEFRVTGIKVVGLINDPAPDRVPQPASVAQWAAWKVVMRAAWTVA